MTSEEKLVQGLKLVVEAFAEMILERKSLPDTPKTNTPTVNVEKTPDKTFKPKEAAEHLGITEHRIRTLAKQGKLKHFRAGNRYLFRKSDLDEWIKEVTADSLKEPEPENEYGKLRRVKA